MAAPEPLLTLAAFPVDRVGLAALSLRRAAEQPATVQWHCVDPLHLLALRYLPGGVATVAAALAAAGLPELPRAGECRGTDPWLVWRSPSETWLVSSQAAHGEPVSQALAPGIHPLCCALDIGAGVLAVDLQGPMLDGLMARLVAAESLPRHAGEGTSARLGEIRVALLRLAADRLWILADRAHDHHLHAWLEQASSMFRPTPDSPACPRAAAY